ncbi:MAG TPA: cytochrome c oxidase subunit 4, partial [Ktedonobacteraceae bacterium]|nr:cytochrome c oxidase subunit 4 [Ktedonobacteraceae bacterium]
MDNSLQNAKHATDSSGKSVAVDQEVEGVEEEKQHIHLPNPSLWPLILSVAILVTVIGLLFIPDNPWISIIGAPFILVGIMGWALEDPMAPRRARYIAVPADGAAFKIGQDVLDKNQRWVGTVQARFSRYLLVERGGLFVT